MSVVLHRLHLVHEIQRLIQLLFDMIVLHEIVVFQWVNAVDSIFKWLRLFKLTLILIHRNIDRLVCNRINLLLSRILLILETSIEIMLLHLLLILCLLTLSGLVRVYELGSTELIWRAHRVFTWLRSLKLKGSHFEGSHRGATQEVDVLFARSQDWFELLFRFLWFNFAGVSLRIRLFRNGRSRFRWLFWIGF